jgi:glycosyltransferase involved in cell wall biosynthesis
MHDSVASKHDYAIAGSVEEHKTRMLLVVQLSRTLLPTTGIGRHCNGAGLALAARDDVAVQLAVAREYVDADGALPTSAPLRSINPVLVPRGERLMMRAMKLTGVPLLDRWVPAGTSWIYCPHEMRLPSRRAPVAITVHDARIFEPGEPTLAGRLAKARMREWMRRAVAEARLLLTVSEHSRRRLIELAGLPPSKVASVGNGVDAVLLDRVGAPAPDISAQPPYIVAVGGLRRIKGGDWLLNLAEALKYAGDPMRIVVIGGPDEVDLVRRARALGTVDRLGTIDDPAMMETVAGARALLLLSRYEGFGLPALEAMALGTPVVAAAFTSLPEVVGNAGILLDPNDTRAIAEAVRSVAKPGPLREELRTEGFARARRHGWDRVAQAVVDAMRAASPRT